MSEQRSRVIALANLAVGDVTVARVKGREIALYRIDDEVYATDNLCTHGNARLCDGFLDGYEIECPLHQGKFDVRDGRAMCEPLTKDVATYPVIIENGDVLVEV